MIPSASSRFGVKPFTASLRLTGAVVQDGRRNAISMAGRRVDILRARSMPAWMISPRGMFNTGRRRSMNSSRLEVRGVLKHGSNAGAKEGSNGGLLALRGGGAAVIAGGPLGGVLLATALLSAVLERSTKAGAVVGAPLLSFATFCILSNLGLVPAQHGLYDLCWSHLLPLSLSIIILGNPVVDEEQKRNSDLDPVGESTAARSQGSAGPIGRVGLCFLIGALGSVAGVAASFHVATTYGGQAVELPRETAAQIAGAVTATYVGGGVNLFAVASVVGLIGATSVGGSSLFGALAAADIFLMSVYFSFLVAVHKSQGSSPSAELGPSQGTTGANQPVPGAGWGAEVRTSASDTISLLGIGSVICFIGSAIASSSPLPGTSTMAVTLLTIGATRILTRLAPGFRASLSRTAPLVATVLLNSFFGSVGASGRWAEVVGVAPAIFVFAALALVVHMAVMAAGAAVANRVFGARLGVDDVLVASNANIGGPSTAATFAGLIGKDELVVPAAVWGTVGYAVATTLGVGVWAALR